MSTSDSEIVVVFEPPLPEIEVVFSQTTLPGPKGDKGDKGDSASLEDIAAVTEEVLDALGEGVDLTILYDNAKA